MMMIVVENDDDADQYTSVQTKQAGDTKQEFLFFDRPYKFFFSEISIYDSSKGPEQRVLLGKVAQKFTLCTREFNVRDDQGKIIYQIEGDCLSTLCSSMCPMFTTPSFYIIDPSTRERVGEIKKKWSGFIKEMYTKVCCSCCYYFCSSWITQSISKISLA